MNRQVSHDVLRRMVSPPPRAPEDVPITSSRAMRLAVTRAADTAHGLVLTVSQLREEVLDLDAMLASIGPEMMLVGMVDDTRTLMGLSALDAGLRSALIEIQTIGMVLSGPVDDRPPTATDAKMAEAVLQAILTELANTAQRTPLDGWGQGLLPAGRVESTRAAGLILPEADYRVLRLDIDLGVEGRTGSLVMALPDQANVVHHPPEEPVAADWTTEFQRTVNASKVKLTAELHRFEAPLHAVQGLHVGQVLPLVGCEVTSVKLRALDGRKVASARLGQSGGRRAVRIEDQILPGMAALNGLGAPGAGDPGLPLMPAEAAVEPDSFGMDMAVDSNVEMDFSAEAASYEMDAPQGAELGLDDAEQVSEDDTSRMLDEMEAALAEDGEAGADPSELAMEAAPLDWSGEFDVADVDET